jgi:flavin-dependent dehydrogenase
VIFYDFLSPEFEKTIKKRFCRKICLLIIRAKKMGKTTDVLIIGGGPVGTYTARQLGEQGLKVIIAEARPQKAIGTEITYIHFDGRYYAPLNVPKPDPASGVIIRTFHDMWQIPLDESRKFSVPYDTDMVDYPKFVQYLHKWAEETGTVQFLFDSPCESVLCENGYVVGASIKNHGVIRAKIVIDATGRFAFVRNHLPPDMGIPPLKTRPGRMFTVYMEEWECEGEFPKGSNTHVCFKGFANQLRENTTLVGASTLNGVAASQEMQQKLVAYHLPNLKHKVLGKYYSDVPFDFPPSTLVGNGFVSVGDAAFLNKPYNGEGIGVGMEVARLAIPIIVDAIRSNDVSQEKLWSYNYQYFTGIGAQFALIRGAGETLVQFTPEEFNWMYENDFLSAKDMEDTWNKYFVQKSFGSILKIAWHGLKNWKVFSGVVKGLILGQKCATLFKKYPKDPKNFPSWNEKWNLIYQKL